jgi:CRP/FNR family nitrogen fixation transcriptional regulator
MHMQTLDRSLRSPEPAASPRHGENALAGPLQTVGTMATVAKDAELFAEGDDTDALYAVRSGMVRLCKILPDGRRQIERFALPGDLIGLEPQGLHRVTAEAVCDCTIVRYRRSRVEALVAGDPAFAHTVLRFAVRQLDEAQRRLVLLGRNTAIERVAAFVLEMVERTGGTGQLDLAMSRADIADYLGLTIETVSRLFSQLRRQGFLDLPTAHRLILLDRAALEDIAASETAI